MKPIPMDIVHEILVKLPVKTLKRFQCVSKPWCSLINLLSFQDDHYRRCCQQNPLLFISRYKRDKVNNTSRHLLSTYNFDDGTIANNIASEVPGCYRSRSPKEHRIWYDTLIQSCHGLICGADLGDFKIFLCYPSTGELLALPPLEDKTYVNCVGFGYAASTNVFKVVWYPHYSGHDVHGKSCQVFTVGTSEWRQVTCPLQYLRVLWWGTAYLNGVIFFLINKYADPDAESMEGMLAFDVESEEFRSFPAPVPYRTASANYCRTSLRILFRSMYLKELRGSLCLTSDFGTTLELWLLKDYVTGEWLKEYTIDLTSLSSAICVEPVEIMRDSSIMLCICDGNGKKSLYSYNPKDRIFTLTIKEDNGLEIYAAISYVEKFWSSPFRGNDVNDSGILINHEDY